MTATLDNEIAELRRAKAELQRRLDEALVRETATAEVLQVINSSPITMTDTISLRGDCYGCMSDRLVESTLP